MNFFKSVFDSVSKWVKRPASQPLPSIPAPPPAHIPIPDPPGPEPVIIKTESFITIPPRQLNLPSGSQFAASIMNIMPGQKREDLILAEVQKGNIPDFMRNFIEVTVTSGSDTISYYALPDYLCIGDDTDFLRVPLNPLTARKIADLFTCCLPTKKIADQIWKAANVKLTPIPGGPPYDASMRYTKKFVDHNTKIEKMRAGRIGLITGHKKDVVICKYLLTDPSRVAIYGWFYPTGVAIQGLNPKDHDKYYEDYSHGIRYISRVIRINGKVYDFYDILKDPKLSSLISHEGAYDANSIYRK